MSAVVSAAAQVLEREREEFEARTPRSGGRFRRALDVFPGGDTRIATFFDSSTSMATSTPTSC
jgi:hypothetical protein